MTIETEVKIIGYFEAKIFQVTDSQLLSLFLSIDFLFYEFCKIDFNCALKQSMFRLSFDMR